MFTYDEKRFFDPAHVESTCSPERRQSMPEKVEMTSRVLRDTLDRLLMFEKTLKDKYDDLAAIMTQDNVTFKELMQDAYSDFVSSARTEINLFETNTNAIVTLFKEAINTRLTDFNENYSQAFADYQTAIAENMSNFEEAIREEFEAYKNDVNTIIETHVARFDAQDAKIDDAVAYMKTNLGASIANLLNEMQENGELAEVIGDEVAVVLSDVYVESYSSVAEAVAALSENSVLHFASNKVYDIGDIEISVPNVKICGDATVTGTITLKADNIEITSMRFEGTNSGIVLHTSRNVKIHCCTFVDCDKAIYRYPVIASNTSTTDLLKHKVAMVSMFSNFFENVNYCFYVDYDESTTTDAVPVADRWVRTSDCHFTQNYINPYRVKAVYLKGIDGFICSGNVFFSITKDTTNENHIHIEKCADQVIISNNNFFESGLESVKIGNVKTCNINGNNFVWCGERIATNALYISGDDALVNVTGNIFNRPSETGIYIDNLYGAGCLIDGNTFYCDENPMCIVGVDTRYAIRVNGYDGVTLGNNSVDNLDRIDRNGYVFDRRNGGLSVNALGFASTETKEICDLPAYHCGLYAIRCTYGSDVNGTGNSATYLALISTEAVSGITIIEKMGVTGTDSASWCNFEFTVESNKLYATALESVTGTFSFSVKKVS